MLAKIINLELDAFNLNNINLTNFEEAQHWSRGSKSSTIHYLFGPKQYADMEEFDMLKLEDDSIERGGKKVKRF